MAFNRYMFIRLIVEVIGVACCVVQLTTRGTLTGLLATGVVALVWAVGEIWAVAMLDRHNPRRDELSDDHQRQAAQFTLLFMIGLLMVAGFALMLTGMILRTVISVPPIALPTCAMLALVVSDARYLWLERAKAGDDDED